MKDFVDDFKERREELGLTISEVAEKTHVRKKYLKAIEEGDFDKVQGEVYLKGFIKIYANFLGLDTEEILSSYEEYRKKVLDESDEVEEKTLNEQLGKYFADSQDGFLGKAIIIVISALILGFAGFYAYNNLYLDGRLEEETEIEETEIEEDSEAIEAEEDGVEEEAEELIEIEEEDMMDEPGDEAIEIEDMLEGEDNELIDREEDDIEDDINEEQDEESLEEDVALEELEDTEVESEEVPANETGEIEIEIVTLEETWYSVTVDEEIVFEEFTEEGDSNTFQGSQIELVIGNAAGVEIMKEDEVLGPFGETGEVIHQEYIVE